jgi:Fe-S cluster biosynthesis and repair protein YggX
MKEILFAYQSYNNEFDCYNPNACPSDWVIHGKKIIPYTHGPQFFTWESLNYDYVSADRMSYEKIISMGAQPSKQEYLVDLVDLKLLDDIPAGQKYIYHISVHRTTFFRLNTNFGFDFISPRVIQDVKNKIAKIVILFPYEGNTGILTTHLFLNNGALMVDEWCKKAGLDKTQVYFIHGNLLADSFDSIVTNYTSVAVDAFSTWVPNRYMSGELTVPKFQPVDDKNLYLCYNRNVRIHRRFLLSMLMHHGVFNRGLISCGDTQGGEQRFSYELSNYNQSYLIPAAKEVCKLAPIELDQNLKINNPASDIHEIHYNNTFISLISETQFEEGILFRSEKIYKTLAVGHPFIVFSCSGFLKSLKELGFKTFDPWIDESYDNEPDWITRLNMITNEIKKLSLYNIDKLHEIRDEMQEVLIHNKMLFRQIYMRNLRYNRNTPLYEAVKKVWRSF